MGELRTCLGCRQTDDHPHHAEILQVAPELLVSTMHLDCCAAIKGCRSCAAQIEGAAGTGDEMRAHIIAFHADQKG